MAVLFPPPLPSPHHGVVKGYVRTETVKELCLERETHGRLGLRFICLLLTLISNKTLVQTEVSGGTKLLYGLNTSFFVWVWLAGRSPPPPPPLLHAPLQHILAHLKTHIFVWHHIKKSFFLGGNRSLGSPPPPKAELALLLLLWKVEKKVLMAEMLFSSFLSPVPPLLSLLPTALLERGD